MPGVVSFTVDLVTQNAHVIPELEARAKDLRPAFSVIIDQWVHGNEMKFDKGIGMESTGVSQGSGVDWQELTPAYMKSKRRLGQGNALMVATGSLKDSMTNPDRLFQMLNPDQAIFGTPLDPDDAAKIAYNWNKRQTIFLSLEDQRMIQKTVHDYFELGGNFQQILFARGIDAVKRSQETARMDIEFQNTVGG